MVHVDLNRLALDIIGESAFGYQFKSVLGVETEITKAFNHLTTGIRLGSFSMALPFYKYLPTKENRLKWNAIKITNEVVMKVRETGGTVEPCWCNHQRARKFWPSKIIIAYSCKEKPIEGDSMSILVRYCHLNHQICSSRRRSLVALKLWSE